MCRYFILLGALVIAQAQPVSVGVSAGVPISPHSQDYGQGCLNATSCGANDFYSKPYAVGPEVGVNVRWGFSIQAAALYERFHKDQTQGLTAGHGQAVDFGYQYSVAASAWAFPLLLRYTHGRGRIAPFVNAGATLRHLGAFDGQGTQLDFFLKPQQMSFHFESGRDLDVAITAGAGLRWRTPVVDVSPEIRYLHWTSSYNQPAQDQAMLMLGISFPPRR
jgi:hypothetical protein